MKNSELKRLIAALLTSRTVISYYVIFFFALVVFQVYLGRHLSNDCYAEWFGIETFPYQASSQGRVLTGLLAAFFEDIGINLVRNQRIFTFIGLAIYSAAITCLAEIVIKLKKDYSLNFRVIASLVSFMIVFNFFSVDTFHYSIMMLPYSFSALFMVLASRCLLLEQNRFSLLKAGFFLLSSAALYQSYTTLFVPICLMGTLLDSNSALSLREKSKRAFSGLAVYGTVMLIDYAYIRLIHLKFLNEYWYDARTAESPSFIKNLQYIYQIQDDLWIYSFDMMSKYAFLLFTIIFASAFFFYKTDFRNKITGALLTAFSLAMLYAALFAPHVFSGIIDVSARSIYTFASIPALIVFAFLLYQQRWFEKLRIANLGFFIIVSLFLFLQIKTVNMFGTEGLIINHEDEFYARKIVDSINDYENKSGGTITTLYFRNDSHVKRCFRDGCYVHNRALITYWSRAGSIRLFTGRNFQTFQMDDADFRRLFEDKDWTEFVPEEQIRFEGDRAHIMVF